MAIDLDALDRLLSAGHPDEAVVGLPISLVREIAQHLHAAPAGAVPHIFRRPPAHGATA